MYNTDQALSRLTCLGLGLYFIFFAAFTAQAAPTFTVNSPADVAGAAPLNDGICATGYTDINGVLVPNGVCTLRAAIMKANHFPGGGMTIVLPALPPGVSYMLTIPASGNDDDTSGDLNILASMSIIGAGSSTTII